MASKHYCPNCGGTEFFTTAHVVQTWKVDSEGNFIEEISTDMVTHDPRDENIWECDKCGTNGVTLDVLLAKQDFTKYEESVARELMESDGCTLEEVKEILKEL